MPKVVITGGTGLVGKALTQALLQKGYEITILTRDPSKVSGMQGVRYAAWDVKNQTIDEAAVSDAEHIIHLAGTGVADKRWTKDRKQEIIDSRVKSGELLSKTIQNNNNLKSFVSASAIGWYGPDPAIPNPRPFTEDEPYSKDYLGTTCYKWEQSVQPLQNAGKRLVKLRTGIVLSNNGGALKEFIKPLRFGIATVMGSGKQVVSWIHIDDLVNLYITAMENENYSGAYNAVAPLPVSNKHLVEELARNVKGKFYTLAKVPSFVLKVMLGEMSIEVLKSATVSAQKVLTENFQFKYPSITTALADLAANKSK